MIQILGNCSETLLQNTTIFCKILSIMGFRLPEIQPNKNRASHPNPTNNIGKPTTHTNRHTAKIFQITRMVSGGMVSFQLIGSLFSMILFSFAVLIFMMHQNSKHMIKMSGTTNATKFLKISRIGVALFKCGLTNSIYCKCNKQHIFSNDMIL